MRRVLFELGPIQIQSFGFMIAVGFLVATFFTLKEAKRKAIDPEKIYDFAIGAIISGIVGARVYYILVYNFSYYLKNPAKIFFITEGGLSIHGGIIGGLLFGFWFIKKHRLSFWHLGDTLAPSIALGQAIGRVGCDVFGVPMKTILPWGVNIGGQIVHPAQVYEFLLNYVLFFLLWIFRKKTKFEGQLILIYIFAYATIRGIVEFFRSNPVLWGPFTVAHGTSLIFILGAIVGLLFLKNKATSEPKNSEIKVDENNLFDSPLRIAIIVVLMTFASLSLYYGVR